MADHLPTHDDFVTYGDLDEESAFCDFGGKSVREVRRLLADNYLAYQEPFMWMGAVAFCFYIDALLDYVHSLVFDRQHADYEFIVREAQMFIAICEFRVEDVHKLKIAPCAGRVAAVLEWLAAQLSEFDKELASRAMRMESIYSSLGKQC